MKQTGFIVTAVFAGLAVIGVSCQLLIQWISRRLSPRSRSREARIMRQISALWFRLVIWGISFGCGKACFEACSEGQFGRAAFSLGLLVAVSVTFAHCVRDGTLSSSPANSMVEPAADCIYMDGPVFSAEEISRLPQEF